VIVIDASALVELLIGGTPRAARVASWLRPGVTLHAPHLIDLEIASVLRTLEARRALTPAAATRAIVDLVALDVTRYPHDVLVPRVWQLRKNLAPYDACYVALAETLGAPLLTCDARLHATPGHGARVELVA
jgi:predicted nucleic acid-binding protein